MNANERAAVARLEAWQFDSSASRPDADDIRLVCAALRRQERLASEGLTEGELEDVEFFRREMPTGETIVGETVLHVIAKLQAQLAEARERITEAEGIASDALEDRGLPRLAAVREETAREIASMACWCCDRKYPLDETGLYHSVHRGFSGIELVECKAVAIRKRFNLPSPQSGVAPAKAPAPETWIGPGDGEMSCLDCNGLGRIPPQAETPPVCRRCNGTRLVGREVETSGGDADWAVDTPCPDCAGRAVAAAERRDRRPEERLP